MLAPVNNGVLVLAGGLDVVKTVTYLKGNKINLCLVLLQNFLDWSKFFEPEQKFTYILWQSQTFCARQKDDLHSVKLVFVPAQKFLKRH